MMLEARVKPIADGALLISFADEFSEEAHQAVLGLDRALVNNFPEGVIEIVPALVNLMVVFDPIITTHDNVESALAKVMQSVDKMQIPSKNHEVHICYETPFSPDLDAVSQDTGLSAEAVINAHLAGDYQVLMYGFAPGYAYLGGLPKPIQRPRKVTPVRDVPAGSVIIAAGQCLVTTLTMPTGWWIIGRSPTRILTGNADDPFLFDVGDRIKFKRVDQAKFEALARGHSDG